MEKFKDVMTTENLVDFLDQKPRVDRYSGNVYFSCPYCRQEALEMLKTVLSKKAFKNVENLDLEFGTLIFNPEPTTLHVVQDLIVIMMMNMQL